MPEVLEAPQSEQEQEIQEPDYGQNFRDIPEHLKNALKSIAEKYHGQEKYARWVEVYGVAKRRFYRRGQQHIFWSKRDNCFVPAGNMPTNTGVGYGDYVGGSKSGEVDGPTFMRDFNIFTILLRSLEAALTENYPEVRFEPVDPSDGRDIPAAAAKNNYLRYIERNCDMKEVQRHIIRLCSTDGRVGTYVTSEPSKYAVPDDSASMVLDNMEGFKPDGQLEYKVPILIQDEEKWPFVIHSEELPIAWLKGKYDWIADSIQPQGAASLGEHPFSRLCRLTVKQGGWSRFNVSDAFNSMTTRHTVWLDPCAFQEAPEEAKEELISMFPEGAKATFVGNEYAEAEPENFHKRIAWMHPIPGDGQNTPSLGDALVAVQDLFNDLMNLLTELFEYCIPRTHVDSRLLESDAIRSQKSEPGVVGPVTNPMPGNPLGNYFFVEPGAQVPEGLMESLQYIAGQLAQLVSGASATILGSPSPELGDTAAAYAMSQGASRGVLGPTWAELQSMFASLMDMAADLAIETRENPMAVTAEGPGQSVSKFSTTDMKGNTHCFPEKDSAFPESWASRRQTIQSLLDAITNGNIFASQLVQNPDNQREIVDTIGIPNFVLPGAKASDHQLREIDFLLKTGPIPNAPAVMAYEIAVQQAQATGQPPPPEPTPEQILSSSVQIDQQCDDHANEAQTCWDWMYSEAGQEAKEKNENGYMNVRLHYLEHKAAAAQNAAPPQGPKESLTMAFDKLPPTAQQAVLAKQGIQVSPEELVDEKVMNSKEAMAKIVGKEPQPHLPGMNQGEEKHV